MAIRVPDWPWPGQTEIRVNRPAGWLLRYEAYPQMEKRHLFGWLGNYGTFDISAYFVSWSCNGTHFDLYERGRWRPEIERRFHK